MVLSKDIFLLQILYYFSSFLKFELSCEGCTSSYAGLTLSTQKYIKLILKLMEIEKFGKSVRFSCTVFRSAFLALLVIGRNHFTCQTD